MIQAHVKPGSIRLDTKNVESAIGRRAQIALTRYGSISRREARKGIKFAVGTGKQYQKAYAGLKSPDPGERAKAGRLLSRLAKKKETRSMAGGFPLARTRSKYASIRNIAYAYEPSSRGVIIGPIGLRKPTGIPETLEYGGTATVYEVPTVKMIINRYGEKMWMDSQTGKFTTRPMRREYRPASKKTAARTEHARQRMSVIRKRPTMALTFNLLQRRKTIAECLKHADKRLGGK